MTSGEDTQPQIFRTAIPTRYRLVLGILGLAIVAGTALAALEAGPGVLVTGIFTTAVIAPMIFMTVRIRVGPQACRSESPAFSGPRFRTGT